MKRSIAIVITIILALILLIVLDKINEDRCYNLPLNDFYKDKSCKKYVEKLGD